MDTQTASVGQPSQGLISRLIVATITGYQRYLSPYKGFRCAHRALHGQESCSEYVKRAIAQNGVLIGFGLARQRFRECRDAYLVLKAEGSNSDGRPKVLRSKNGGSSGGGDATGECLSAPAECVCGEGLACLADSACSSVALPCSVIG